MTHTKHDMPKRLEDQQRMYKDNLARCQEDYLSDRLWSKSYNYLLVHRASGWIVGITSSKDIIYRDFDVSVFEDYAVLTRSQYRKKYME